MNTVCKRSWTSFKSTECLAKTFTLIIILIKSFPSIHGLPVPNSVELYSRRYGKLSGVDMLTVKPGRSLDSIIFETQNYRRSYGGPKPRKYTGEAANLGTTTPSTPDHHQFINMRFVENDTVEKARRAQSYLNRLKLETTSHRPTITTPLIANFGDPNMDFILNMVHKNSLLDENNIPSLRRMMQAEPEEPPLSNIKMSHNPRNYIKLTGEYPPKKRPILNFPADDIRGLSPLEKFRILAGVTPKPKVKPRKYKTMSSSSTQASVNNVFDKNDYAKPEQNTLYDKNRRKDALGALKTAKITIDDPLKSFENVSLNSENQFLFDPTDDEKSDQEMDAVDEKRVPHDNYDTPQTLNVTENVENIQLSRTNQSKLNPTDNDDLLGIDAGIDDIRVLSNNQSKNKGAIVDTHTSKAAKRVKISKAIESVSLNTVNQSEYDPINEDDSGRENLPEGDSEHVKLIQNIRIRTTTKEQEDWTEHPIFDESISLRKQAPLKNEPIDSLNPSILEEDEHLAELEVDKLRSDKQLSKSEKTIKAQIKRLQDIDLDLLVPRDKPSFNRTTEPTTQDYDFVYNDDSEPNTGVEGIALHLRKRHNLRS